MSVRLYGWIIALGGGVLVTAGLLTDFNAIMIGAGLLIIAGGITLSMLSDHWLERLLQVPILVWIGLIFAALFVIFFVPSTFFSQPAMQMPPYVDAAETTGIDIHLTLGAMRQWFSEGRSPYLTLYYYSPLSLILLSGLLLLPSGAAYPVISLITIACFIFCSLIFPFLIDRSWRNQGVVTFLFVIGLFGYGLLLEIERGNFNVIAMFFALSAIYIYHRFPRLPLLAFVLFTIAVQLKLYPAIFGLFFLTNWRDWKRNLKTVLTLAGLNIASVFALGPAQAAEYVTHFTFQSVRPSIAKSNLSIYSFVARLDTDYSAVIALSLLALFGIAFVIVVFTTYRRSKQIGVDPYLLLACTIGALLLPTVSHNYKLPLLVAPLALMIGTITVENLDGSAIKRLIRSHLTLLMTACYFVTWFSYVFKPRHPLTENDFAPVFAMLLLLTVLAILRPKPAPTDDSLVTHAV